jgi:RNA polymerase sigma factor (sigma-70 family)
MFRLFVRQRIEDPNDREDIVQTAMAKISREYRQVLITTSFAAWAHTVLKNELIEHFRRSSLRYRKHAQFCAENQPQPGVQGIDRVYRAKLSDCLKQLRRNYPRQARVLNLHYLGFSPTEISEKLQIEVKYCHVLLFRARSTLARYLRKRKAGRG